MNSSDVVFRQGDVGKFMYIVIRGSVEIRLKSAEYGGLEITFVTLYDGDHFGELAVTNDKENEF